MRQGIQNFAAADRLFSTIAKLAKERNVWIPPRETYTWTWPSGLEKSFQECSREELLEVATTLAQEMKARSEATSLLR